MYLSRVEIVPQGLDYFVNVRPLIKIQTDGTLSEINNEDFNPVGTINISGGNKYKSPTPYLEDKKYFLLSLSDEDIRKARYNKDPKTGRPKIYVKEYLEKCSPVTSSDIAEVIQLPIKYSIQNYNSWKNDYISDVSQPLLKKVYLEDKECIAGPFTWNKSTDGRYNFVIDAQNNKSNDQYMLSCYDKASFNGISHEFRGSNYQYDPEYYKVFAPQNLPEEAFIIDCIDDEKLKKVTIEYLSQNSSPQDIQKIEESIASLPSLRFSESRRSRIRALVENQKNLAQIIKLIPPYLMESEEYTDKLISIIYDNPEYREAFLSKIEKRQEYITDIANLESQIREKKDIVYNYENQIEGYTQVSSDVLDEYEARLKDKDDELSRMGEDLSRKEIDNQNLINENKELVIKYRILEDTFKQYKKEKSTLNELLQRQSTLNSINDQLSDSIKQKVREAYSNLAIDGVISSMMIQEAAEFERNGNEKKIQEAISTLENIENKSSIQTASDLVDFIEDKLKLVNRYLSRNDIANILICISQGFLTVFAGEPGCGKTSLVSLLAQILGLSNSQYPRYQEIAVEKGWTSRRDLIGYYNPLTKSFEAANKGMFTALEISEAESKQNISTFPYWILLDEANLSQMEHYWADFMGICDLDKNIRQVSLNENYVFRISPTLRFLATINLDHTTEVLSPRLVDRAWIIKLKAADINIEKPLGCKLDENCPVVEYSVFEQLSSPEVTTQKLDPLIVDRFNQIRGIFLNDVGIDFSPRVIDMIRRYCLASKVLMDTSTNSFVALDYAIAQKILPMIDGYGQKYKNLVEELIDVCDNNRMPICNRILLEIQQKAESNMQYYQFFAR